MSTPARTPAWPDPAGRPEPAGLSEIGADAPDSGPQLPATDPTRAETNPTASEPAPTTSEPDRAGSGSTAGDSGPIGDGLDAELIERLNLAGRELRAATVLFHTTLAQLRGLSPTEEKAVDLLMRAGPLTHAALGEQTGLAPASVSDLIDRLERKGYARRVPHPQDRRRVLVEAELERIQADMAPLFAGWIQDLQELYKRYSRSELELLCDFMTRAAARQQEAAVRLTTS